MAIRLSAAEARRYGIAGPKGKRQKAGKSKLEEELAAQIKLAGLPAPEREYKFHPTRKWRLDFYFDNGRHWGGGAVGVEVHGGIWAKSRHTTGAGFRADCEKRNAISAAGIRLIEVTDKEIKSGEALKLIEEALQ